MIKNHEIAWLSLKNTLLHIIWAEDSRINYSVHGLEDPNNHFLILISSHGVYFKSRQLSIFT